MTKQEHLESAIYMIRNLLTGDEEQIRIEEEDYLLELPDELSAACRLFIGRNDHNAAIWIYAHWHLREAVEPHEYTVDLAALAEAAKTVSVNLRGDESDESEAASEREEQTDWVVEAKLILG
jgi:hypothetical protein